jgi:AraC family transcriptional regulator, regulatory protein of adaptative response / methylated-DNA-[protein]-cysteine methyltransferase
MANPQTRRADAVIADPRWQALTTRDAKADGAFVYAVETTGVYCRPACPSRLAKPENIRFFATPAEAEAAGFRPCKRCKPEGRSRASEHAEIVAAACRFIEDAETPPSLAELAAHTRISAFHLHRMFKAFTGVTPKAYATARRAERLRRELGSGNSVTGAIYDAGYNSSGRFYAESDALLGMTPSRYRKGGAAAEVHFAIARTSLGAVLVAETIKGICAIDLGDDPETLIEEFQARFPTAALVGDDAAFDRRVAQVVGLIETPQAGCDLPLDIRGTAFQRRVWEALRRIPSGDTLTYTALAASVGAPSAVRAVARACATNTLAVAIPCHRVVRLDGALAGYRWGIARKRALLDRERS